MKDALIFWAMHCGRLQPPLFVLFVMAAVHAVRRGWRERQENWNFAAAFFVPLFLVFVRASLKTNVHVNWTAPAYLSLLLATAAMLADDGTSRVSLRKWVPPTVVCTSVVLSILLLVNLAFGMPRALAYTHAGGWRQLGNAVEAAEQTLARTNQKV